MIDLKEEIVGALHQANLRGVAIRIAEDLIGYPFVNPTRAAQKFEVSYQAAHSAINRLRDHGVLREVTGRSYARMFMAPRIVEVINR